MLTKELYSSMERSKSHVDTEMIGVNLISATFVTTHCIPFNVMKEPTIILIAREGLRPERHKECTIDHVVDKLQTKGHNMLVGNLVNYHILIGMPFLKQEGAMIV